MGTTIFEIGPVLSVNPVTTDRAAMLPYGANVHRQFSPLKVLYFATERLRLIF